MRVLVLALALVVAGALAAPVAAAQETPTENGTAAPPEGERIDEETELIDSSFDAETGMASVTLRSDSLQQLTLTDAGGVMEGGDVERRTVTIGEETATYRIPATEVRGMVAVTVDTGSTLYAVPIEISQPWFDGDPTWGTTRIVGGGALFGVLVVAAWLARKRLRGGEGEVEQLA